MRKPSLWILVLGAGVLLGLAGCGGGTTPPPGGNGSGSSITLTVVDARNVGYAVAYQVGSGPWTALTNNSNHTYTFDLNGNSKYGVAVRCNPVPDVQSLPKVYIIQATNAELGNPTVICSSPNPNTVNYTLNVNVNGNVQGVANGDIVVVRSQNFPSYSMLRQSGNNLTASVNLNVPEGKQDLVVTVQEPRSSLYGVLNVKAASVLRDVNITSGGSDSYTFTSVEPTQNVSVVIPSGFSPTYGQATIHYVSGDNKGNGLVGYQLQNGALSSPFPYRPVAGFDGGRGDRYVAEASVYKDGDFLMRFKGARGGSINLDLPSPWSIRPTVTSAAHPTVGRLSYSNDPSVKAYVLKLVGSTLIYRVIVSKGWLGGDTDYTVPNLSSQLTYTPFASGETVKFLIMAILSPASILDIGDLVSLTASTDISLAGASGSYTVGGQQQ